jgi:hypothetical protein
MKWGIKLINTFNPIHGVGVDTTGKSYIGRILFICESKKVPGVKHNISVDTEIASGTLNDNKLFDGVIGRTFYGILNCVIMERTV